MILSELSQLKVERTDPAQPTMVEAIERLRCSLPSHQKSVTRQLAEATFGISFSHEEMEQAISSRLPRPPRGKRWFLSWIGLSQYTGYIPEQALERVVVAEQSLLFSPLREKRAGFFGGEVELDGYYVIEAKLADRSQVDPWLVGHVKGEERYIVLAYWD